MSQDNETPVPQVQGHNPPSTWDKIRVPLVLFLRHATILPLLKDLYNREVKVRWGNALDGYSYGPPLLETVRSTFERISQLFNFNKTTPSESRGQLSSTTYDNVYETVVSFPPSNETTPDFGEQLSSTTHDDYGDNVDETVVSFPPSNETTPDSDDDRVPYIEYYDDEDYDDDDFMDPDELEEVLKQLGFSTASSREKPEPSHSNQTTYYNFLQRHTGANASPPPLHPQGPKKPWLNRLF